MFQDDQNSSIPFLLSELWNQEFVYAIDNKYNITQNK